MRAIKVFFIFMLAFSGCKSTQENAQKEIKNYTIEQFMDNTTIFGGSISYDDELILIGSNKTGIFNAYTIPVTGGEPSPLTTAEETIRPVSFFPDDKRILYRSDQGGNEIYHLFMRDTAGVVKELTTADGARAVPYGWAHDGKSFFFGYNQRNPKFMDIYEMDIETFEPEMLYQNDEGYSFNGISDSKQYMALSKSINTNDSDLFIYDFNTKELTKISETQAGYSAADFSKDNNWLYYMTDKDNEFQYLMRYNIASGDREKILESKWDISYAYFSHNGRYRVVGINNDGKTEIQIHDTQNDKAVNFPKFEDGDITSVNISRSEKLMSFYLGSSRSPSNLYIYNFESGEYKQLTNSLSPEIEKDDLVEAEVIRFKSFDGLEIPAIYYKPKLASADNKAAALVWVHGGPGGQSRVGYNPLIQYLVNHGYALLMVNNRGSSGYGKTFFQMDDRQHGEGDLQDCIEAKNYLASLPYINKDEIGILGGSYGGFMVMRALTHTPEEFEVGVNLFGVTNWIRTVRSIPPWWESFKDALYKEIGDPYSQDSVRLYEISPLFHADKVKRPVMILQGAKDPRVLQVESDEMVEAIRENEVPVEYVLFDDEGHGFVKKDNQIEAYGKILEFLDKYLKKEDGLKG